VDDDHTIVRRPTVLTQTGETSACLIILSGQSVGKMFKVDRTKYVIGRGSDADIRLDDEGVSRHHAQLVQYGPGVVSIRDLNSTNGTYVNGNRIEAHVLSDGDRIQFGSVSILKFSLNDSLEEQFQQQLYAAATRDAMTGAYNKRYFEEQLGKDFSHAKRHEDPLSVMVADIDFFKQINDTHGHLAGDYVLKRLCEVFSASIRNEDALCRIGGEEFALIMRGTDLNGAAALAERLRAAIQQEVFDFQGTKIPVTISAGVATYVPEQHTSPVVLVEEADQLLYAAKRGGRNRVCLPKG